MRALITITDIETGQTASKWDEVWNDGDEAIWTDGTNSSDANRSLLFQMFSGRGHRDVVHMRTDPPRRFLVKIETVGGRILLKDEGL
jgi:hypothetical protein